MNIRLELGLYRHRLKGLFPKDNYFFIIQPMYQNPSIHIYGLHLLDRFPEVLAQAGDGVVVMASGTLDPEKFDFAQLTQMEPTAIPLWASRVAHEAANRTQFRMEDFLAADVRHRGISLGLLIADLLPRQSNNNDRIH
jgi:hypothetical protein